MGVLEQVIQMKNQGSSDEEITAMLREEGISPRDIRNALDQSKVKNAVSAGAFETEPSPPTPSEEIYTPQTEEIPQENVYGSGTTADQEYYYPQQSYSQEQGGFFSSEPGYSPEGYNTDTMIEIAEQVFSEKIKKTNKIINGFNEFQALYQTKIENALERIKRIESIIDKLQITILEKIGSYGQNLESIKKEMSMMQNSFSKMVPSLTKKAKKKSER